jgi:hypothetical protein
MHQIACESKGSPVARKAKEKSAHRNQPEDAPEDQNPGKDRDEIPSGQGGKRRGSRSETVVGIQGSAAVR